MTIQDYLRDRGMTQSELAERIGTSQSAISRALRSSYVNTNSLWPEILEALGLEVVVMDRRSLGK